MNGLFNIYVLSRLQKIKLSDCKKFSCIGKLFSYI